MSCVNQMRERHPPRLADRLVPAGHADVAQVRRTLKTAIVPDKELTAPDTAVSSQSCAVEADADDRPDQAVLGHAARHVSVMVLDGTKLNRGSACSGALLSIAAGRIIRV